MAFDGEPGALFGDMGSHQGHGNFDIEDDAAGGAMDMIVPLGPPVVARGLIREGEFLDQAVLDEEMEGAVDGAIADPGITLTDALEDFSGGQVFIGGLDDTEDEGTLCSGAEALAGEISRCGVVLERHLVILGLKF